MIKAIVFDYGHTLLDNENSKLYDKAENVLEQLDQKGTILGLVSGTNKEEFRLQQLYDFGIFPYFKYVKFIPHSDKKDFRPVLENFKLKPEEILIVGDRITSEITEGKKLGMKTCRILRGPEKNYIPSNDFEKPDYTIENISEVINFV